MAAEGQWTFWTSLRLLFSFWCTHHRREGDDYEPATTMVGIMARGLLEYLLRPPVSLAA